LHRDRRGRRLRAPGLEYGGSPRDWGPGLQLAPDGHADAALTADERGATTLSLVPAAVRVLKGRACSPTGDPSASVTRTRLQRPGAVRIFCANHAAETGATKRPDGRARTSLVQPFPDGGGFSDARRAVRPSRTVSRLGVGSGSVSRRRWRARLVSTPPSATGR